MVLISTHAEEDFVELIEASPAVGFLSKSKLSGSALRELLGGDVNGGDVPGAVAAGTAGRSPNALTAAWSDRSPQTSRGIR